MGTFKFVDTYGIFSQKAVAMGETLFHLLANEHTSGAERQGKLEAQIAKLEDERTKLLSQVIQMRVNISPTLVGRGI